MATTSGTTHPTGPTGEADDPPKPRMTRRQRARLSRGIQYAVLVIVVAVIAFRADWGNLQQAFFNTEVIGRMFPRVLIVALVNTLLYTALAFVFGLLLGIVIALMRLSSVGPYRWLASAYVELFRGLPALLVLFFVAYGIPNAFPGFTLPFLVMVTVGLGLTAAAYMSETIRAGIQAVPRGQVEAARTLGMSPARTMVTIVLPQAFRIVIPPLTNEIILLTKDSSLVYVLGVTAGQVELTKFSRDMLNTTVNSTPLLIGGLLYLCITLPLSQLVRRLEIRHAKAR
ncbi:amino acid ABC transporter permease [Nakamurella sp. YIM 132084]|uniref:Amino acid ABC transporter permease n=2 Tax=Nakamurella leprariae TaxID=2803911 RepID=A0A939BX83_9ACTN|nr:amino acid ABC transporter permease [Nakamurella leprariae]MBM9468293.1 amino acid ABC transporter permease [Nakamurella leprariae]